MESRGSRGGRRGSEKLNELKSYRRQITAAFLLPWLFFSTISWLVIYESFNLRCWVLHFLLCITQLEEKEEQIEDHESQIRELRGRLERAKKMNEAMKTLIDKDPSETSRASNTAASPSAPMETKQTALEISSYRREIDSMRKEIAIVSLVYSSIWV